MKTDVGKTNGCKRARGGSCRRVRFSASLSECCMTCMHDSERSWKRGCKTESLITMNACCNTDTSTYVYFGHSYDRYRDTGTSTQFMNTLVMYSKMYFTKNCYTWVIVSVSGHLHFFPCRHLVGSDCQMRYDSLFNSKKWPSDSSKGSVTPTLWPSHSVKLLYAMPNYSFSNLGCSGLE